VLKAKLVAKTGSVCLDRGNFIAIELQHPDWAKPAASRDWPMGREQYVGPAMYPVSSTGMLLDVLDSQSRYVTVDPRRPIERLLRLTAYRGGLAVQDFESPFHPYKDWIPLPNPLGPGRYHVRARLVTETSYYFAHPLFWKPYDKPVIGETEIVIGGSVTTTAASR